MRPVPTLLIAAAICVGVLLLAVWLDKAAKASHRTLETREEGAEEPSGEVAGSPQVGERIAREAMGLDLGAHPRPTRGAPNPAAGLADDDSATATRLLSLGEAAEELGVSTGVLLAWEARYGYPKAHRSTTIEGRAYSRVEVLALAESLQTGLSIPSAVDDAQATANRRRAAARRILHNRHPSGPGSE
jgi:hypothetical protein